MLPLHLSAAGGRREINNSMKKIAILYQSCWNYFQKLFVLWLFAPVCDTVSKLASSATPPVADAAAVNGVSSSLMTRLHCLPSCQCGWVPPPRHRRPPGMLTWRCVKACVRTHSQAFGCENMSTLARHQAFEFFFWAGLDVSEVNKWSFRHPATRQRLVPVSGWELCVMHDVIRERQTTVILHRDSRAIPDNRLSH